MFRGESHQITQLLVLWSGGDRAALDDLMPIVYDELRRMAKRSMNRQESGHTIQTTELIHEAYLKLAGSDAKDWKNKAHFFGVACPGDASHPGRLCPVEKDGKTRRESATENVYRERARFGKPVGRSRGARYRVDTAC